MKLIDLIGGIGFLIAAALIFINGCIFLPGSKLLIPVIICGGLFVIAVVWYWFKKYGL